MEFGEQIKSIRAEKALTQEQMAGRLSVTRQAISNWENDRNLPDIEMLISIARTFDISLDRLILGGKDMNGITEKLIKDGGDTRRARMNMISLLTGAILMTIGILAIVLKAVSVEYVDQEGILHENFFLLPIGFLFLFCGFIAFLVTGIKNTVYAMHSKDNKGGAACIIGICASIVGICIGCFLMLLAANSGEGSALPGAVVAACGLVGFLASVCFAAVRRKKR